MNRRTFLALLAALPVASHPMGTTGQELTIEYWARRNFEPLDPHNPILGLHPLIRSFKDTETAGIAIQQLQSDGFLHQEGRTKDDYSPIELLDPPQDISLPSALLRYESAAPLSSGLVEIPYLSLVVQRGAVLVSLMIRGSDEPLMMETVAALMLVMLDYDQSTGEVVVDETGRRSGGLWDLMLHEKDAPPGFRMYQEADDGEVTNFYE